MNARRVHAVLAAGVENPTLITAWRVEPARLTRLGVNPAAFDLDALWKFAGLTIKVRHNGVRQQLPCTFRLMAVAGIEIGLFADYAASRKASGQRYAATTRRDQRPRQFITNWIDPSGRSTPCSATSRGTNTPGRVNTHAGSAIRDDVTKTVRAVDSSRQPSRGSAAGSCPRDAHNLFLLADAASRGSAAGRRRASARGIAGRRRLSEIAGWSSTSSHYQLSLVDGCRSIADLSQTLGGGRRPTRHFTRSLAQLEDVGLLTFGRGRRSDAA